MLLLLDLSVAFETIDHEILLERLRVRGGVCSTALAWFRSYLTGRTQSVRIHNTTSKPRLRHSKYSAAAWTDRSLVRGRHSAIHRVSPG